MSSNLITSFLDYKVRYLSDFGSLFFPDYKKEFINDKLSKYFRTLVNGYFYHIFETLDNPENLSFETMRDELIGKKEELLDEYSICELEFSDEEYKKNCFAIEEMVKVCLFVFAIDRVKFTSKDSISEELNNFVKNYPSMKEILGNNIFKLVTKIKEVYSVQGKVFKDDNPYYVVDYSKVLNEDVIFTKLVHSIKLIDANYKNTLVARVYSDKRFEFDKLNTLVWKLSRDILDKTLNRVKIKNYLVYVDEDLFERGKFLLSEEFDNPILKKYINLVFNYNTYKQHEDLIKSLGYRVSCIQDLSHINEVVEKLNSIDNEGVFDYILVSDYKEKDEEDIKKFKCRDDVSLFILKEE